MPTKTYIDSPQAPGIHAQEVDLSTLTNVQPGTIASSRVAPFSRSNAVGVCNRLQGVSGPKALTDEQYFYCQMDRVSNDKAGNKETLSQLEAKGHTVFFFNNGKNPSDLSDYEAGKVYMTYGNFGTTSGSAPYDHDPGYTLRMSLQKIYDDLNAVIVPRPGLKYCIANFEYKDFYVNNEPGASQEQANWPFCQNKNDSFYSPAGNSTTTLQQLYDQGGIPALNAHLHAKRMQLNTLWMKVVKEKNPGCKVTNGDAIPFQGVDVNGDLIVGSGTYQIKNYKTIGYGPFRELMGGGFNGFENVPGGNVTLVRSGQNVTYDLSGIECDHWDFFVHYYYYQDIFCRSSDYNDVMNSTDPAKNTVAYYQSKFWISRHHVYVLPASDELRRWFLTLHAQNGGKDLTTLLKYGMREHMIEANKTYVTADNSPQTKPTGVNYEANNPPPFFKWIPANVGSQKMYMHREFIWTRTIQDAMCYGGTFIWWENIDTVDFAAGKWQYLHAQPQEDSQAVRDHLRLDEDLWGQGSTLTMEGISYRWRRNGGAWTAFAPSPSPVEAWFGQSTYQPYILRKTMPAKGRYYSFHVGQEDADVTDIEFVDVVSGKTFSVTLTGCMPQTRAVRDL